MSVTFLLIFSYLSMVGLTISVYYVIMQFLRHIIELGAKLKSRSIPGREYIDQDDSICLCPKDNVFLFRNGICR